MADLARLGRVSRARITQVMDLAAGAGYSGRRAVRAGRARLRELMAVCRRAEWSEQRK